MPGVQLSGRQKNKRKNWTVMDLGPKERSEGGNQQTKKNA